MLKFYLDIVYFKNKTYLCIIKQPKKIAMAKKKKIKTVQYTGAWVNLQRAYEIALLGGYKIVPMSFEPMFEDFKAIILPEMGEDILSAEDGLTVELYPLDRVNGIPVFNLDESKKRVEAAKDFEVVDCEIDQTSEMLLKTAQRRMSLSETTLQKIIVVSKTVAQLDKSDRVRVEHVAEAIHFFLQKPDRRVYNLMLPEFANIMGVNVPVYLLNPENKHDLLSFIDELKKFL